MRWLRPSNVAARSCRTRRREAVDVRDDQERRAAGLRAGAGPRARSSRGRLTCSSTERTRDDVVLPGSSSSRSAGRRPSTPSSSRAYASARRPNSVPRPSQPRSTREVQEEADRRADVEQPPVAAVRLELVEDLAELRAVELELPRRREHVDPRSFDASPSRYSSRTSVSSTCGFAKTSEHSSQRTIG